METCAFKVHDETGITQDLLHTTFGQVHKQSSNLIQILAIKV